MCFVWYSLCNMVWCNLFHDAWDLNPHLQWVLYWHDARFTNETFLRSFFVNFRKYLVLFFFLNRHFWLTFLFFLNSSPWFLRPYLSQSYGLRFSLNGQKKISVYIQIIPTTQESELKKIIKVNSVRLKRNLRSKLLKYLFPYIRNDVAPNLIMSANKKKERNPYILVHCFRYIKGSLISSNMLARCMPSLSFVTQRTKSIQRNLWSNIYHCLTMLTRVMKW